MLRGTRRGACAVRMELPETTFAYAGRRAAGAAMGGTERAYLLARLPARASAAQGDHRAEPGSVVDRRDRQSRRGVRGLSAGIAFRLPDKCSRTGNVEGSRTASGDFDIESRARTVGGAAPPMPAPIHRFSGHRAGAKNHR